MNVNIIFKVSCFCLILATLTTSCSIKKEEYLRGTVGEETQSWNVVSFSTVNQPNGIQMTTYNLNNVEPFCNYISKTVHFYAPCSIVINSRADGYYYFLKEERRQKNFDAQAIFTVDRGKIIGIKGTFFEKNNSVEIGIISVLLEFQLPYINAGRPFYLSYEWSDNTSMENCRLDSRLKQAPWEARQRARPLTLGDILREAERHYQHEIRHEYNALPATSPTTEHKSAS